MRIKITKRNILPLISFPLLFIAIFVILFLFWKPLYEIFSNHKEMKALVNSWGLWAPLVFIGLQILQVVVFIIPGEVPQVAGGYLFGIGLGILYSTIGITIGSAINFFLARLLGIPFVKLFFKEEQFEKIRALTSSEKSKVITFLIFLIPGIPKDIMTYVAGLTPMKFFVFLIISTTGRLPGIIGSAIMGDAAAAENWPLLIGIFLVATILFFTGYFFKDRIFKLMKKKVASEDKPDYPVTDQQN